MFKKLIGESTEKSPWLFHINAGSCNGCDIELVSVLTPRFDAERLGFKLVGSPRHADIVVVTGPVTKQSLPRVLRAISQVPEPRCIVTMGSCPQSGNVFKESWSVAGPLKGLFSKSSCEMYPFVPSEAAPRYRGRIVFHPEKCINCGMCERVCAGGAIKTVAVPVEGGQQITRTFNLGSCTFCSHCADFCHEKAIELTGDYHMVATKEEDLIVSGTFFKAAPKKPAPKPAAAAPKAEAAAPGAVKPRDDGKPVQVPFRCVYCTLCAKKCPAGALTVDRAAKTWTLDEDACVGCGTCAGACPKKAILMPGDDPVAPPAPAAEAPKAEAPKAEAPAAAPVKPRDDGKPVQDPSKCVYCTLCAKKCPAGALTVDRAAKTWTLDEDACVACGTCAGVCPKDAIVM